MYERGNRLGKAKRNDKRIGFLLCLTACRYGKKGYGTIYHYLQVYSKLNLFGRKQTLAKNKTGICFVFPDGSKFSHFQLLPAVGGDIVLMHVSNSHYTVKKRLAVFPSPAGMSLTELSLAGNNDVPAGDGKFSKLLPAVGWGTLYSCMCPTPTIHCKK